MDSEGTITRWISAVRDRDEIAAHGLWEQYIDRLLRLAKREIGKSRRQSAYDEEDVALSAFNVFCRNLQEGQYPELDSRDDLWRLLVVITVRKANDRAKRESAAKRGGGASATVGPSSLEDLLSREVDPQLHLLMAEQCQQLLDSLGDEDLMKVAALRLDGHTNQQISHHLGTTRQTVQRKLRLIREIWKYELEHD